MKIKMTNNTAIEIIQVINKFSNCTGKLGYVLSKTKRKISNEVKDFEDIREKLVVKYGEKTDDGQIEISPGTENYQKFLDEILPLSQEIIEVEVFRISQEEFDNSDYYNENAMAKDYEILEALFVEKETNNADDKNDGDE